MTPPTTVSSAPGAAAPVAPTSPSSGGEGAMEQAKAAVGQAGQEAREITRTSKDEARRLAGEARSAVRTRVDERSHEVSGGLNRIADELQAMAQANPRGEGPIMEVTQRLADMARSSASRLDREGPDGMIDDVRRFARQRPALFLGAAFGLGIVAGRFLRGDIDERRDASSSGSQGVLDLRDQYPTYDDALTAGEANPLPSTSYTTAGAGLAEQAARQPQDPYAMGGGTAQGGGFPQGGAR